MILRMRCVSGTACVCRSWRHVALTLVTQFDIALVQAAETLIGNLSLYLFSPRSTSLSLSTSLHSPLSLYLLPSFSLSTFSLLPPFSFILSPPLSLYLLPLFSSPPLSLSLPPSFILYTPLSTCFPYSLSPPPSLILSPRSLLLSFLSFLSTSLSTSFLHSSLSTFLSSVSANVVL